MCGKLHAKLKFHCYGRKGLVDFGAQWTVSSLCYSKAVKVTKDTCLGATNL